jgi:hypothetical protein
MKSGIILAEMASATVAIWRGIRLEVFTTFETEDVALAAGDRIRGLFSEETQQIFVLEKIA